MADFSYDVTFAGVPFCLDVAKVIRMDLRHPKVEDEEQLPPRKHQPLADLVEELDRLMPFLYLQDFSLPSSYPGRNLGAIAYRDPIGPNPSPQIKIGDFYYPPTACRWSVFRGLATSSQVKAMLAATNGRNPATFKMQIVPQGTESANIPPNRYLVQTPLHLLPPRALAEFGTQFDGLFLVTLVDERYFFQGVPGTLFVEGGTTWAELIAPLTVSLGITLNYDPIASVYGYPEPDSHLWTNSENAPILLDAIAANVGCMVVRNLDGTYTLQTATTAIATVAANRGPVANLLRTAGGDIFQSSNTTKSGDLRPARNAVLPEAFRVTFPKYINGDDPVPHFLNPRYGSQRPTTWYEESFGDTYAAIITLAECGPLVQGLTGFGVQTFRNTAKALFPTEAAASGAPSNLAVVRPLAVQLATDYCNWMIGAALDETYPGTLVWTPEGYHDIIWSWSARNRQGTCRVLRTQWNAVITEFQHSCAPLTALESNVPRGVGGPSVSQTWTDGDDLVIQTTLASSLSESDFTVNLASAAYLPTQNLWKARIDSEVLLLNGTGGGTSVIVARRGIDGTVAVAHGAGTAVTKIIPNSSYGVNYVACEKNQFIYPSTWNDGILSAIIVPQTQSVEVTSIEGEDYDGQEHYPGLVRTYQQGQYVQEETIWIIERNGDVPTASKRYDGQFIGTSGSPPRPTYLINIGGGGASDVDEGCGINIERSEGGSATISVNAEEIFGLGLVPFGECGASVGDGCGIRVIGGTVNVYAPDIAGPGLEAFSLCGLAVSISCGLQYIGNSIAVKSSDIAGPGLLPFSLCGLGVDLGCGLQFVGNKVSFNPLAVVGPGLTTFAPCGLAVFLGCNMEYQAGGKIGVDVTSLVQSPGLLTVDNGECLTIGLDIDCGLRFTGNHLEVDPTEIIGPGLLTVNASTSCRIYVDLGCNLEFFGNKIQVNIDTLSSFYGLRAVSDLTPCPYLEPLLGCGLYFDETNVTEEGVPITLDTANVQGAGLIDPISNYDLNTDPPTRIACRIDIDPDPVEYVEIIVAKDASIALVGCSFVLTVEKVVLRFGQNDGSAVVEVEEQEWVSSTSSAQLTCNCICDCLEECEVVVSCCEEPIPITLYAHITNKTGDCTCMPDMITLTYLELGPDDHTWFGAYNDCNAQDCEARLWCVSGGWTYGVPGCDQGGVEVSIVCSPFEAVFTVTNVGPPSDNCNGSYTVTITGSSTPP